MNLLNRMNHYTFENFFGKAHINAASFCVLPEYPSLLANAESLVQKANLPISAWPEYVAHHVAGDVGRGEFLAQLVQRPTIIVGDGNDVTHGATHPWQLPLQHHRLAIADQG